MVKKILLLLASLLFTLFLCESALRFFVQPSDSCGGIFLGRCLPPAKIKFADPSVEEKNLSHTRKTRAADFPDRGKGPYQDLVVQGRRITGEDLFGISREDELLAYAPLESAVSVNGWWQSNALGALRRSEVAKEIPPHVKKRMIVFGESLTQCIDVPLEDSWPFHLEKNSKETEVINFGVAGYSMSQAYLRYKMLSNKVDHHVVLLAFSPAADLMREVNVYRGFLGWPQLLPMPRFKMEGDHLKLIKSPYENSKDFIKDNRQGFSDRYKAFLREHDRFYFVSRYETLPILRESVLLKLMTFAGFYWTIQSFMEPGSEALQISKKIFEDMDKDARQSESEFVLLILPDLRNVLKYKKNQGYRERWGRMVSAVVGKNMKYIDLMQGLKDIPESQLDAGHDGEHYGASSNRWIAELIARELPRLKVG